jgi:uncharacterized protein YaeQ
VYSFNTKSDVWWKQNKSQFETLPIQFFAFQWAQIQALAKQVERKSSWSITISDDSLYVSTTIEQLEMNWRVLK